MDSKQFLTKKDFWEPMERQCPKIIAKFKAWIDQYKKDVRWTNFIKPMPGYTGGMVGFKYYKYHDLPDAMQIGIWIEYSFTFDCPYKFIHLIDYVRSVEDMTKVMMQHIELCEGRLKDIEVGKS